MPDLAIYALTPEGAALGARLRALLGGDLHTPERMAGEYGAIGFDALGELVAGTFGRYRRHAFIAACGIVVRVIAPLLRDKSVDPAVAVMDAAGRHVISLLSGHVGGANDLAHEIAGALGAVAVITTATDVAGVPAVDVLARDLGMVLENAGAVKHVSGALVAGKRVGVFDPGNFFPVVDRDHTAFFEYVSSPEALGDGPQIRVDWREGVLPEKAACLRPRVLHAGVGCRRGVAASEITAFVREVFAKRRLSLSSLAGLASIEAKRDEAGLLAAARDLGVGLQFYTAQSLSAVRVPNPSERVRAQMGVDGVCEAAAMLSAGTNRLLIAKQKTLRVTLAVALAV